MAYLGERPIAADHPFANSQISFGQKRPGSSNNASPTQSNAPQAAESLTSPPLAMDDPQQMAALQDRIDAVVRSWDESTSPESTPPESPEAT